MNGDRTESYREWLDGEVQEWGVARAATRRIIFRSPRFGPSNTVCLRHNEQGDLCHMVYRMPEGWRTWYDEQPYEPESVID